MVTSAWSMGGNVGISGSLGLSAPTTQYTIQMFRNTACDGSGAGEGESLFQTLTVTTDTSGIASFSTTFPAPSAVGSIITATATNNVLGDTSPFSTCYTIPAPKSPSGVGQPAPSVTRGEIFHLTMNVTSGLYPASTGLTVVADATAIGLSASLQLFDQGLMGGDGCDDIAGDNTFIACATASLSTPYGVYVLRSRSRTRKDGYEFLDHRHPANESVGGRAASLGYTG